MSHKWNKDGETVEVLEVASDEFVVTVAGTSTVAESPFHCQCGDSEWCSCNPDAWGSRQEAESHLWDEGYTPVD